MFKKKGGIFLEYFMYIIYNLSKKLLKSRYFMFVFSVKM